MSNNKISAKDRELARQARRAYTRDWAKKNPDKVKATTERYWLKKAKEIEAAKAAARSEEVQE